MTNNTSVRTLKTKINGAPKKLWKTLLPKDTRRRLYHMRNKTKNRARANSVSIVVPVYNVQDYLKECVDSILRQTYKNLEIVLVDDGSTDKSGLMCDELATIDDRVRVIHQKNGGLSAARNTGLDAATGKYIMFIDSDDIIPSDSVSKIMRTLLASKSDMATGNVKRFKGDRIWDGWNQSYSHKRSLYTVGPTEPSASGISLRDHPELLFDATAWNKIFRRTFLLKEKIRFPEGKLYEDMYPMAQAFNKANSVDIVFDTVYYYRVREDNSSITQKRAELKNLADKVEMADNIYSLVSRQPGSDRLLREIEFKMFEGDLPVYSPYLGVNKSFDDVYYSTLSRYWEYSTTEVKNRIALPKRAQLYWETKRDAARGAEACRWLSDHFFELPVWWDSGVPRVDLSDAPDFVRILGEQHLDDMSRYFEIRSAVTETNVRGGRISVEGYAFLDEVPQGVDVARRFYLRSDDGNRVLLESSRTYSEWANDGWWHLAVDRSDSGFEIDIDLSEVHETMPLLAGSSLYLEVEFEVSNTVRRSAVYNVWRGGQVRLGGMAPIQKNLYGYVDWSSWNAPLTSRARRFECQVVSVSFDEDFVEVEVSTGSDSALVKSAIKRIWDDAVVYGRLISSSINSKRYRFDLGNIDSRSNAFGHNNAWKVLYAGEAGDWLPATVDPRVRVDDAKDIGWDLRTDCEGSALLIDPSNAYLVREIQFEDGVWILRGTVGYQDDSQPYLTLWSKNGASYHVDVARSEHDFSIRIDPTVVGHWGDPVAWKTGDYNFWLRVGTRDSPFRLRASRQAVDRHLPDNRWTDLYHTRIHLTADNMNLSIRVGPPTTHAERGRFNLVRMKTEWLDKDQHIIEPETSVVFSSYMSRNASDSVLAISEYMANNYPEIAQYWATEDGSVSIPSGSKRLVKRTNAWFEKLTTSIFHVNNVGTIEGYGNRPHQTFVQTWHGTPFKLVGKSELGFDGFKHHADVKRIQEEAARWDLFVSQNDHLSTIARKDFDYTGRIIESGYPRNDKLVEGHEKLRNEIREKLGIKSEQIAILYAPTWREQYAFGTRSRMVDFLDYSGLLSTLGSDYKLLLRGHNFNAADSSKNMSANGVIDVTHYSDINDIIAASDVLVTDYSSIMFDYLVTRRPIVHFVPDIAAYIERRGSYTDLEEVASGPIVYSQQELVRVLADLVQTQIEYSSVYANNVSKFVPWDDGHSTKRVVAAMFESSGIAVSDGNGQ